jgi:hypothetical protein
MAFSLRIIAPARAMVRLPRSKSVASSIVGPSLLRCRPEVML